ADPRDDPRRRHALAVDVAGGERRELEERRLRVAEPLDPFAREELAALLVLLDEARRAVRAHVGGAGAQIGEEPRVMLPVRPEFVRVRADAALQDLHRREATPCGAPAVMRTPWPPRG